MLELALPLILAEIGWMSMGLVDTVMVGHMANPAIPLSAASLAQILYNTFAFGLGGVLLGLDTTVPQAHGAGDLQAAHRWLFQGIVLVAGLSVLLMGLSYLTPLGLRHLHTDPRVLAAAIPTIHALGWGTFPLLLYFALRRHLQAFNHVGLIAATLVSANLVNIGFDWLFIFDHPLLHWHGMGVVGSGVATSLARVYQALCLIVAMVYVDRRNGYGLLKVPLAQSLRPHVASLRRLLVLGLPSGATILIEILIFAVVTAIIATLGPVPLAGHELALNRVSFTFMIPLGISAAASVRVGQAVGRGSIAEARAAGWAAIAFGAGFMLLSAAAYLAFPRGIAGIFTYDQTVIAATIPLLFMGALFQFCDGLQVTAIGALRGAGDTLSGLITHLCTYWLLGLPLGLYLCFRRHMGARGLWLGLTAALIVAGVVLVNRWRTLNLMKPGRP